MIKIDVDTRCWEIPKEESFLGVESDDKVKILQFELSKNEFCDGLNFTDCNCFINYKNEGNDTIPYGITDMALQEDGTVTFTWEVHRGATIFKGNTFAVLCAKKVRADGTITNEWNSRIGSFKVSKGLEPLSSIVEVPEIDIISQLLLVAQQTNANAQNNIDKSSSLLKKAEGLGYLKEEYDVLEARMNQFTSLQEGSTTGDAELLDIRVKADGTTAASAGNAIREQFSELKGDLEWLSVEALNSIKLGKVEKGNSEKEQDITVEPSTKYVIVMYNAENDGVARIRPRRFDKSYISNNDYNLTANTPLKVEFTTTKDTYYLRVGGTGTTTNYNIIIYKYNDSLARESDLKDITEEIKELKNQGVEEIESIKQSILYGDVSQYLNFVKGSYSMPSSGYNPDINYNACVKVYLKAGTKLKILNNEYYIKYNLSSSSSWVGWTNEDVTIQSGGEYSIVAKKEPSGDFSYDSQLKTLNDSIFAIVKGYTIKDKCITKEMLGFEIGNSDTDFIDVVKDKNICNDNSIDITNDIQSLLNVANTNGFVSLYFPKGTYKISSTLYYYGRTRLLFAEDAVINVNTKSGNILSNANRASTGNNYNLGSLEIDGGTFKRPYTSSDVTEQRSVGLQCCQLELLSVKNCTFVDCCSGNHLIDISGCKEVIIENNIFKGMHLPSVIRPTREAHYSYITDDGTTMYTDLEMIQIDHGRGLGQGTITNPTKNVKIINNVFMPNEENTNSVIYRPIGSHTVSDLDYYRNIEISGNKFVNPFGRVISISKAIGVKICDNEFINNSQNVICDIVRISLNVNGNNDSKNIIVVGNSVNYSVDTNNYKFFKVESNGVSKVINAIVKWNDVGNFTNDYTNCENIEHD